MHGETLKYVKNCLNAQCYCLITATQTSPSQRSFTHYISPYMVTDAYSTRCFTSSGRLCVSPIE